MTPPAPRSNGTTQWRLGEVEKDVLELGKKVDRLFWAVLTLALSIAGSAVVFALTVSTIKGR